MLNSDVTKYKLRILNILSENEDIVEAMGATPESELMYNYLYPYFYIDNTQEIVKNYICITLDHEVNKNEYFKDSILTFYVICHKNPDNMKTKYGGVRTDLLEGLILDIFNWELNIGLELKAMQSREKNLNENYYMRIIPFKTLKFNSLQDGIKHQANPV